MNRLRVAWWSAWAACAAAVVAGVIVLVAPLGGPNRMIGVLPALAAAAILAATAAMFTYRSGWLGGVAYAAAAVALIYALLGTAFLPIRLGIAGTGVEPRLTSGETFALYCTAILGAIALLLVALAAELRYFWRSRR